MKIEKFWKIIDQANTVGPDFETKCERLGIELRKLSAAEVKSYHEHMINCVLRLIHGKVMQAVEIMLGEARGYNHMGLLFTIISMGESVYEKAIASPDTLAEFDFSNLRFLNALFGGMAGVVYEEKTKEKLAPPIPTDYKPSGRKIEANDFTKEFPRLIAKYRKDQKDPFELAPWTFRPVPEALRSQSEARKSDEKKVKQANKACKMGEAALRDGKFDRAIEYFTKAIELNPHFADAYKNRGDAKSQKSDFTGAITDYDKAIEITPEHLAAYQKRFDAKRKIDDMLGAFQDLDKIRAIQNPKVSSAKLGVLIEPNAAQIRSACQKTWVQLEIAGVHPPASFEFKFTYTLASLKKAETVKAWLTERQNINTGEIVEKDIPGFHVWRVTGSATTTVKSLAQLVGFVSEFNNVANENEGYNFTCQIILKSGTQPGEDSVGNF